MILDPLFCVAYTKWTDVDFDAEIISVNKQWTNKDGFHELKTGDWRVVPINQDLKCLLNELKTSKNQGEFILPRLMEWTHGDQAKVLRDFCQPAGITSIKFHDLRATCNKRPRVHRGPPLSSNLDCYILSAPEQI